MPPIGVGFNLACMCASVSLLLLDLEIIHHSVDAVYLRGEFLSSRPLLGGLHDTIERNRAVVGIDVDPRKTRKFIRRQLRLDRTRKGCVIDISPRGFPRHRLTAGQGKDGQHRQD